MRCRMKGSCWFGGCAGGVVLVGRCEFVGDGDGSRWLELRG